MAKEKNNTFPKRSRSSKPYNDKNSFVKQMTSRVSRLLPRGISNWLTMQDPEEEDGASIPVDPNNPEEESEERYSPPTKRVRSELNEETAANIPDFSSVRSTFAHLTRQNDFPPHDFIDASVAGPSGITKRQQLVSSTPAIRLPPIAVKPSRPMEQLTNGDDHSVRSDSSISTSGCSSLVPQVKHHTQNKTQSIQRSSICERDMSSYLQTSRSIFPDNSFSPRANSSLGKGRPSFNTSVFSNPLSHSAASTTSERIPHSPFYMGRTQFGGASAYKRPRHSLFTPNETQIPTRQSIQVKSLNSSNVSDLNSCTARRILDALDNLSSPVLDAKRIPSSPVLGNSRKRPAQDASPIGRTGGPSVQDLTIPTVPDLLKLQRRAKMQDSMEAARRISASPGLAASSLSATEREYKMRLDSCQANTGRQIGKMTTKMKDLEQEMTEGDLNIPNIALPISVLPKFNFKPYKPTTNKYSFSQPTRLDSEEFVSTESFANSKFGGTSQSKPEKIVSGSLRNSGFSEYSKVSNVGIPNFTPGSPAETLLKEKRPLREVSKKNEDGGKISYDVGVAQDLKVGSVMDILGKKKDSTVVKSSGVKLPASSFGDTFKPPPGSWECTLCMVRNKDGANKCVSCETPNVSKPQVPPTVTISTPQQFGFDSKFMTAPGSWECDACMVRNKDGATSCVSCTTPKPGPKPKPVLNKSTPHYSADISFGNQFKAASDVWECSTCMVRNKEDASKCIACTTPKPVITPTFDTAPKTSAGFGNLFKAPGDTWECSSCMVRNKLGVDFCIACETRKQGSLPGTLNQASIKSVSGFGDMFKKPEGSWECPDCMLSNKDVVKCAACEAPKPGTVKESIKSSSTIKFNVAIPPEASGFKFGIDKSDVTATTKSDTSVPSFQFGASKAPAVTSGFSFGIPATSNANSIITAAKSPDLAVNNLTDFSKLPTKPITTPASFSFGSPKPLNATTTSPREVVNGLTESTGSDRKRKVLENTNESTEINVKHLAAADPVNTVMPLDGVKSTFSFGSTSVPPASTSGSMVSINGSKTATSKSDMVVPTSSAPAKLFSFPTSKPASTFGGFSSNTTNPFGASATTVSTSTPTPFVPPTKPSPAMIAFGATTTEQKPSEALTMGPAAKKAAHDTLATSKEVGFGALSSSALSFNVASSTHKVGSTPRFGTSSNNAEVPSFSSATEPSFSSFVASAATDNSTKTTAPFTFGSMNETSKPSTLFSSSGKQDGSLFGNVAPKATGFSFGSQNVTTTSQPTPISGGFSFNINPATQKAAGGFSFGSSNTSSTFEAPTVNPVTATPVFGAAAQPSTFGGSSVAQTKSAGFSFGASSQPSPAVFGFGASTANQSSTPTPFAFGQSQVAAAPSFNPNVRPTFNFTGGDTPQFTAAVVANPAVQARRIIKKAVRRGPR